MKSVAPVWDLDVLYPRPETDEFAGLFRTYADELKSLVEEISALPAPSGDSAPAWGQALQKLASTRASGSSLRSFVGCHAAADATNATYQQYEAKLAALSPLQTELSLTIESAFGRLSNDDLAALCEADGSLAENRFYLEEAVRDASFRLDDTLEKLHAELSVDGLKAWSRLYDRLSGALRIEVMEKGEVVAKSPGQVQWDMVERPVRQNNWHAAQKAWRGISETCADALNHISGQRLTKYARLGDGAVSHLDYPLRLNRMSRGTLDAMYAAIDARSAMLVPYLEEKSRWLGIDKPAVYDIFAPLPLPTSQSKMTYDEACSTVVDTLNAFSERFGGFSQMALENQWVEAEDRAGKRQGGFCTDLPVQGESRIFMTFTGSPDSMSVLAHELGHAYHTYLLREEPVLLRDYPMNLAETASTFAEAVVGQRRLEDCQTDYERLGILDGQCSDGVAFLMNLRSRFLFEDAFHNKRHEGELSVDDFEQLMVDAQKQAYHGSLADDGYDPLFWASKLHFYIDDWPFYNFPYTFGYLLSLGLYAEGTSGDTSKFADGFDKFLVLTGRMQAEDAVREGFGHDLTQPTFWNQALDEVERRVGAFMELSGRLQDS